MFTGKCFSFKLTDDIFLFQHITACEDEGLYKGVFKFPDISGPMVAFQNVMHTVLDFHHPAVEPSVEFLNKRMHQFWNIFNSLAQWGRWIENILSRK